MSMSTGPNPYLKTKVLSASPEELRLMLFDGAIKFARQALGSLEKNDFEGSYNNLTRAQKIVMELSSSLDHKVDPELTEKMAALYTFIYKLLVDANTQRVAEPINEAIQLLTYERETWSLLIAKVKGVPDTANAPLASSAGATPVAKPSPYGQTPGAGAYSRSA